MLPGVAFFFYSFEANFSWLNDFVDGRSFPLVLKVLSAVAGNVWGGCFAAIHLKWKAWNLMGSSKE